MIDLQIGDTLTLQHDSGECRYCEGDIGYDDYDMPDYEGETITIEPHNISGVAGWAPACGAKVFEQDGWLWTTCWIKNYIPMFYNKEPDWEV